MVKETNPRLRELQLLQDTAEYRSLNKLDRAIRMVQNNIASERLASQSCDVSRSRLKRALESINEGREIGKRGRPKIFNEDQEKLFIQYMKDKFEAQKVDYRVARDEINIFWTLLKDGCSPKIPKFSDTTIRSIIKRNEGNVIQETPVDSVNAEFIEKN